MLDLTKFALDWDKPMTSKQAAVYHLTGGFIAVELYRSLLHNHEKLEQRNASLEAEIERLSGALNKIAGSGPVNDDGEYDPYAAWSWCYDIAQESIKLAEEEEKKCEKCGGAGWVRGYELDDPDNDTATDTMTRYSCDWCRKRK